MKKAFLLFPLTALALSACSNNAPAPVVNAKGYPELSPGVMQPISNTGMDSSGWQTDVQAVEMPTSMSAYNNVNMPSYSSPSFDNTSYTQPTVQAVAAPVKQVKAQSAAVKSTVKTSTQNIEIPRDANNAPIYSQIEKGFYSDDTYTVRKGDTMFLISYIAGMKVEELARLNNLSEPYQLRIGQQLKLANNGKSSSSASAAQEVIREVNSEPQVTYTQGPNGTVKASDGTISGPVKASAGSTPTVKATAATTPPSNPPYVKASEASTTNSSSSTTQSSVSGTRTKSSIKWQWPTQGNIDQSFSESITGNQGIDISGTKGQAIYAAADGKVSAIGKPISGYGEMVIIKHANNYLSIYAYNDKILVNLEQDVKAGQKIATMGIGDNNKPILHFEIRQKTAVKNPLNYLPKR